MSLKAGLVGSPAELLDGAKVNSLTEYTTGNGVQLQGRTNGVAIEAGKPGEIQTVDSAGLTIGSNQTDYSITSRILPAGRWMVIVTVFHGSQGVAMSYSGTYKLKVNGSFTTGGGNGTWGVDKITLGYYQATGHIAYCNSAGSCIHAGLNLSSAQTVTVTADYVSGAWAGSAFPTITVQYIRIA
jgi:hypothetical protein